MGKQTHSTIMKQTPKKWVSQHAELSKLRAKVAEMEASLRVSRAQVKSIETAELHAQTTQKQMQENESQRLQLQTLHSTLHSQLQHTQDPVDQSKELEDLLATTELLQTQANQHKAALDKEKELHSVARASLARVDTELRERAANELVLTHRLELAEADKNTAHAAVEALGVETERIKAELAGKVRQQVLRLEEVHINRTAEQQSERDQQLQHKNSTAANVQLQPNLSHAVLMDKLVYMSQAYDRQLGEMNELKESLAQATAQATAQLQQDALEKHAKDEEFAMEMERNTQELESFRIRANSVREELKEEVATHVESLNEMTTSKDLLLKENAHLAAEKANENAARDALERANGELQTNLHQELEAYQGLRTARSLEHSEIQAQEHAYKMKIGKLEREQSKTSQALSSVRARIRIKVKKFNKAKTHYEQVHASLNRQVLRRGVEDASTPSKQELEANNSALSLQLSEMTERIESNDLHLESLLKEFSEQTEEIKCAEAQVQRYKSEATSQTAILTEAEERARIQSIENTLAATASEAKNDGQVSQQKKKEAELESSLEEAQMQARRSDTNAASGVQLTEALKAELTSLQAKYKLLVGEVSKETGAHLASKVKIKSIMQRLEVIHTELTDYRTKLQNNLVLSTTLQSEYSSLRTEAQTLRSTVQHLEGEDVKRREHYDAANERLVKEVQEERLNIQQERLSMATLGEQLATSRKEVANAQSKYDLLNAAKTEVTAEISIVREDLRVVQTTMEQLRRGEELAAAQVHAKLAASERELAAERIRTETLIHDLRLAGIRIETEEASNNNVEVQRLRAALEISQRKLTDMEKKEELADARILTTRQEIARPNNNSAKFKYATAAVGVSLALGGYASYRYRLSRHGRSHKMRSR